MVDMGLHVLYIPQYRTPLRGELLQLYGQVCAVGVIIILVLAVSNDIVMLHGDGRPGSEEGQSLRHSCGTEDSQGPGAEPGVF